MKTIQDFDKFGDLNEQEGPETGFDTARFVIAMKRASAALAAHDVAKFVNIYNSQIKNVIHTPEARKKMDLLEQLGEAIEDAKLTLSPEQKREVYLAVLPKLVEQIDKDPELKARYEI